VDMVGDEAGVVDSGSSTAIFVLVSPIPARNDCVWKRFPGISLQMQKRVQVLCAPAPVDRINNFLNTC
jgi:hypothetical protein